MHKEVLDRLELERGHVVEFLDVVPAHVAGGHAQHFVVSAGIVFHLEHAHRSRLDQAPGEQ
jgi:hypothetical protein